MEDKKAIGARLQAIRVKNNLTGKEFGELLGIGKAGVSSYELGKTYPKIESVLLIADKFNEDVNFILTGKKPEETHNATPEPIKRQGRGVMPSVVVTDTEGHPVVPLINRRAAANYLSGAQSQEYFEHLDVAVLPKVLISNNRQTFLLQIVGDSMEMRFPDGDWVACSKLERAEWEYIKDLDLFAVVSKTHGIQFKRVKNRLKQYGFIRCRSDNRQHPPFNIQEDDLLELWRFQLHISANGSNLNEDIFNKVDFLEDSVQDLRVLVENLNDRIGKLNK